jgi:hypothetical protein
MLSLMTAAVIAVSGQAFADDSNFSTHLYAKFQTKGCTICHDFHEKELGGIAFTSHKERSPEICVHCHTKQITGFKYADEWFAQPDLYTSGMTPQQTCEAFKTALHAKFKNKSMVVRQVELHLFEDPRVLWGIEGATPNSGMLPGGAKEKDLVKGGFAKWKEQVNAWIQGGMKCQ